MLIMKGLSNHLTCAAAGMLSVVAGLWGVAGEYSRALAVLGSVVAVVYVLFAIRAWLYIRAARRELAKLGTPARLELQMPYYELAARFQALIRVDEGVQVSVGYLSWAAPEYGRISISREGESDWKALFWLNDNETHGLALYHRGMLAVYPASAQALFETPFMKSILLPTREEFNAWLSALGSASRK
jgi:hypothetical protein